MSLSKTEVITKGYIKRVTIIEKLEVYQSKEDAHGGPGLYPQERVLAEVELVIPYADLKNQLQVNA